MLTKAIQRYLSKDYLSKKDIIISLIASFFSVLFSSSIIRELYKTVDSIFIMVFLTIFVVLFLLWNEKTKVIELRKHYKHEKHNKGIIAFTFVISLTLSVLGIYFWTNNSFDQNNIITENKIDQEKQLNNHYNAVVDSINSLTIEENKHYNDQLNVYNENLKYWKSRKAMTANELIDIRKHIAEIEENIINLNKEFDNYKQSLINNYNDRLNKELSYLQASTGIKTNVISRGNNISLIFIIMTLITEFIIIQLAKEFGKSEMEIDKILRSGQGKEYKKELKLLSSLYSILKKDTIFVEKDLDTIRFVNKIDYESFKKYLNVYLKLNILSIKKSDTKKPNGKPIYTWKVQLSESEALNRFNNYYEKLLTL